METCRCASSGVVLIGSPMGACTWHAGDGILFCMRKILLLLWVCLLTPAMMQGDVADQSANGFTIKIATFIHAGPSEIYDKLVHHVDAWWSSDHTFSQDAHNLSIDDKPMGCFCEKLPSNGAVRHAEVIMVMPNKMLVMSGALGPLQRLAATGTLSFVLLPIKDSSRLEVTYAVGGYTSDGINTWAAPVDKVLTEQVGRLKNYVETGSPEPAGAKKAQ